VERGRSWSYWIGKIILMVKERKSDELRYLCDYHGKAVDSKILLVLWIFNERTFLLRSHIVEMAKPAPLYRLYTPLVHS
jgi:hypothetical protein